MEEREVEVTKGEENRQARRGKDKRVQRWGMGWGFNCGFEERRGEELREEWWWISA